MEKGSHINIFDFDETLFRVPNYTCKEATGMEPYEWYDSPGSLSSDFNIRGIDNIINRTKEECLNYLVTHRVKICQERVLEILAQTGVRFTKTYFLGRGSEKAETVINLIREAEAESITIFEDSLWEIIKYTATFLDAGLSMQIDFVFVDKSKIITIDWETARSLEEFSQAERLKLI